MSDYSGYQEPVGKEGQKAKDGGNDQYEKIIKIEDQEFGRFQSMWHRELDDLRRIAELVLELDAIKGQARETRDKRIEYGIILEHKYDIPKGRIWDIDEKDGTFMVRKMAAPPGPVTG